MPEPIFEITSYNPSNNQMRAHLHPSACEQPKPWRWPLGRSGNRDPMVLAEHVDGGRRGADLGYAPASFDRELFIPVHAVQDGEVAFAAESSDGYCVTLDHGALATHYAQLSQMFVTKTLGRRYRRQNVRAGDVIGYTGKAPLQFRFELWSWTTDNGFVATDPQPYLQHWGIQEPVVIERLGVRREPEAA